MTRLINIPIGVTAATILFGLAVQAATGSVSIWDRGEEQCISSNGLPDHATGTFPNRGNPHSLRAQNTQVCITTDPQKGTTPRPVDTVGIAQNGVIIRPATADYYDPNARRGFSRDRRSGWTLEGMGASDLLGLDQNNAHVDERGLYHYHGMPPALADTTQSTLVGWAADGFEIHYVGTSAKSSWILKAGTRPTGPGGAYDGTYVEDYEFVSGYGNLDRCNGALTQSGDYVYFATDTFPFFPRCLYGTEITRIR